MRYLDSPAIAGSLDMTNLVQQISDSSVPKREFREKEKSNKNFSIGIFIQACEFII